MTVIIGRRELLAALGSAAAAWPLPVGAQQSAMPVVGVMSPLSIATAARNIAALRNRLRELGYTEGHNINIEYRFGDGLAERFPVLVADLVALKPAVIVVGSTAGILAARKVTRITPLIWFGSVDDPVALGLVESFARPGGNVTGFLLSNDASMVGKRLELLRDAVHGFSRVGAVLDPEYAAADGTLKALPSAARELGLEASVYEVRSAAELEATFAAAARDGMQALYVPEAPLFLTRRSEIAAAAASVRLPAIYTFREFVQAGGLMSYGGAAASDCAGRFAAEQSGQSSTGRGDPAGAQGRGLRRRPQSRNQISLSRRPLRPIARIGRRPVADPVAAILALGPPAALAAKAATRNIPIVFAIGADPVQLGLVSSLNRPGGNITGVTFFVNTLGAKRLELLRGLVPSATVIGFVVNPSNPTSESQISDVQAAARAHGIELLILNAGSERDIDAAFTSFVQKRANAIILGADGFFLSRRDQLVGLAARYGLPAMYYLREFTDIGGLISYGASITDAYRLTGGYVGRILKGEQPADLPVQQTVKFELAVNLKAAKALGLTVPLIMQMTADQVIE